MNFLITHKLVLVEQWFEVGFVVTAVITATVIIIAVIVVIAIAAVVAIVIAIDAVDRWHTYFLDLVDLQGFGIEVFYLKILLVS